MTLGAREAHSLLVLMHRDALLAVPVSFPPSFSTVAFTSSLFRASFPRVRIFMLDSGLSGMGEENREAGLLFRKGWRGGGEGGARKPGSKLSGKSRNRLQGPWTASAPLFRQLLPWEECENRSKGYWESRGQPASATGELHSSRGTERL